MKLISKYLLKRDINLSELLYNAKKQFGNKSFKFWNTQIRAFNIFQVYLFTGGSFYLFIKILTIFIKIICTMNWKVK